MRPSSTSRCRASGSTPGPDICGRSLVGHREEKRSVRLTTGWDAAGVVATASAGHHEMLRDLGASELIDYHDLPIGEQLSAPDAQKVLELGGHYIFVRPDRDGPDALARLVDAEKLHVHIAETFPLEKIAEAHRCSEQGHVRGKIVVTL